MEIILQKSWLEIKPELEHALKSYAGTAKKLSISAEIDYFSARRYLISPPENQTKNALKLCSYFNIEINLQNKTLETLLNAAYDAWDGTDEHAKVLIDLIGWSKSLNQFRQSK